MPGALKRLILLLLVSASVAAGLVVWLSPDPLYTLQAWSRRGDFWDYDALIAEAGRKHGVDPLLLKAVVWRESAFQQEKVGTSGERGLMQVREPAARDWAKAGKVETFVPTDLFDPKTNLEVGAWYLKKALERWKGKPDPLPFALAEYNAGHTRVERWLAAAPAGDQAGAPEFMSAIDFPSTRRYVEDIIHRFHYYQSRGRM